MLRPLFKVMWHPPVVFQPALGRPVKQTSESLSLHMFVKVICTPLPFYVRAGLKKRLSRAPHPVFHVLLKVR